MNSSREDLQEHPDFEARCDPYIIPFSMTVTDEDTAPDYLRHSEDTVGAQFERGDPPSKVTERSPNLDDPWRPVWLGCNLRKQSSRSTASIFTTTTSLGDRDEVEGGDEGEGGNDGGVSTTGSDMSLKTEVWWSTLGQVGVPFFIAGIGTIGAGLVLDKVQAWPVFQDLSAIFILVPTLLGLKGNLDTCLASRLSTLANMGSLNTWPKILHVSLGNVSLVQVQAIVASLLASLFAITVGAIMEGSFTLKHAAVLCASSLATATCSCFILDFLLIAVIIGTKSLHMNPDNLAAPVAASIGDVVSLSLLALISSTLYTFHDTYPWIPFVIVGVYLFAVLPMWVTIVMKNNYVRPVLTYGWVPLLSALFISGMGGLVLDQVVGLYQGFVVFQPIINGIGGNLVSIQSSRICTMLHQSSLMGILPPHSDSIFVAPWRPLFHGLPHAFSARLLLGLSVPGQIVFIFAADYFHSSDSTLTWEFVVTYLVVSFLQVSTLLYMAHVLVHTMWKRKVDPDSTTVPYLTATGDLLGSGLLALAFMFLHAIGKEYSA